jgi:hypothetical protein
MGTADGVVPPDWPGLVQAAGLFVYAALRAAFLHSAPSIEMRSLFLPSNFRSNVGHLVEAVLKIYARGARVAAGQLRTWRQRRTRIALPHPLPRSLIFGGPHQATRPWPTLPRPAGPHRGHPQSPRNHTLFIKRDRLAVTNIEVKPGHQRLAFARLQRCQRRFRSPPSQSYLSPHPRSRAGWRWPSLLG